MSNLIARPGQTPDLHSGSVQQVQIRDLGREQPVKSDDGGEFNVVDLLRALRRRRKLVGLTAVAVMAITAMNTLYKRVYTPVYQGSFTLLISDPISSDGTGGGGRNTGDFAATSNFEALARNTTSSDIDTLIEVLRSPVLLEGVASRFGLSSRALASRITITTLETKRFTKPGILNVRLIGRNPAEDRNLLNAISQTYLQASLKQRQQRLNDGLIFLNRQAPLLEKRNAEVQAELAAFRKRNNSLEPTEEGVALKERLASAETNLITLQAERSRLIQVRGDVASGTLSARGFQEAIGGSGGGGGEASAGSGGGGLTVSTADQSLLQELLNVETELAEARSRYSSSSTIVRGLEARLQQLKPLLQRNQLGAVDAALLLNAGRLETAERQLSSLSRQFLKQPDLIRQYDSIQQKLNLNQANLAGLVRARENLQLEMAQRSVPWRVIAPPQMNPNPIAPSLPKNMVAGVLLGLVAGAGAGLLRDRLDHVFHHPGEVKDELGLPLLGHIPHVNFFQGVREDKRFLLQELDQSVSNSGADADARKQQRYQRFFYQEAFRNLFTSLRFLNSDRPLKSVALTSSLPAEGKSLVNVLLAKTLSEMGQRVLLIDADLRKPQIHHRLGINNLAGLTNVLTDDGQHWRQVVQSVPGYENWSVISAGRRPPDPTRLLSSQRMHQLVAELTSCGEFDLVLFDTPPVLGLADAALVAEHCDGLMLLVSLGRVDRGLPREAVNRIRSSGVPLLGIVTNAVKETSQSANAYGYGYGYGSAYGYGGYGYAAYDTTATYAYYTEPEDTDENSATHKTEPKRRHSSPVLPSPGSVASHLPHWLGKLKTWRHNFMRWLDT